MKEQAKSLSVKDGKDVTVFYVNGMAKQSKTERSGKEYRFTDARTPTPFRLQIKSPTTATVFLPWQKDPFKIEPKVAMDMTVVILNHYDKQVVAVKHFVNSHGCYVLIPE